MGIIAKLKAKFKEVTETQPKPVEAPAQPAFLNPFIDDRYQAIRGLTPPLRTPTPSPTPSPPPSPQSSRRPLPLQLDLTIDDSYHALAQSELETQVRALVSKFISWFQPSSLPTLRPQTNAQEELRFAEPIIHEMQTSQAEVLGSTVSITQAFEALRIEPQNPLLSPSGRKSSSPEPISPIDTLLDAQPEADAPKPSLQISIASAGREATPLSPAQGTPPFLYRDDEDLTPDFSPSPLPPIATVALKGLDFSGPLTAKEAATVEPTQLQDPKADELNEKVLEFRSIYLAKNNLVCRPSLHLSFDEKAVILREMFEAQKGWHQAKQKLADHLLLQKLDGRDVGPNHSTSEPRPRGSAPGLGRS